MSTWYKNKIFGVKLSHLIIIIITIVFMSSCMQEDPLHKASRVGDVEKIKKLLAEGSSTEVRNSFIKNTPLMTAARDGQDEAVTLLLKRGTKIDATSKYGNTALILAA